MNQTQFYDENSLEPVFLLLVVQRRIIRFGTAQ